MKKALVGPLLVIASLELATPVQAIELTYVLEGTIAQKNDLSHLVDMVSVGDKVTYTILVDSEAPNLNMPGSARYDAISASLQIGVGTFECEVPWIWVTTDWSNSNASSFSIPIFTSFENAMGSGEFALIDWNKAAISDDRLPTVPYDFSPFDQKYLTFRITNPDVYGDYSTLSGSFDSLTIIPEPTTCSFLLGFLALGMLKRRITVISRCS